MKFLNNLDVRGYITQSNTIDTMLKADASGKLVAAVAGVDYAAPGSGGGGSTLSHDVKLGEAINKGQAVYVSGSNGTNMIVSKASNDSEATSSKTLGLIDTTGILNDPAKVITEGLIEGIDTSSANAGDPVWLGTNGNLIFGLANKPTAPSHLVYLGVVTRVQQNNGEIFVNVQNGFETNELHDVISSGRISGDVMYWDGSINRYASISSVLGYTPYNATNPNGYISGITGTMVTNALGYTPYNSTNPAGYITSASLTWSNISSRPTTLSAFTNDSGYITANSSSYFGINNTSNTSGNGISLYGSYSGGAMNYGIMFAGTSTYGTYGAVSGDWATYFMMNDDTSRGWIFRRNGAANVASISGGGNANFAGYVQAYGDMYIGAGSSGQVRLTTYNNRNLQVKGSGSSDVGIFGQGSGGQFGFQLYGDGGGSYGFLDSVWGGWKQRFNTSGEGYFYGYLETKGNFRVNANTNIYLDYNYGQSVVGVYSASRYQGVWSMGDAYKLGIDGTSTGNLYGLAWSHPNAGGQAGYLTNHGLIHMMYGTAFATISDNIWCRNNITAYSDIRVKENIEVIPNAMEKINAIRGVTFTRNDVPDKSKRHVGVIAQEIEKVLPEVITKNESNGHLSVAYGNISALTIEGLKEHDVTIKQQQRTINLLLEQVKYLKEIIDGFTK